MTLMPMARRRALSALRVLILLGGPVLLVGIQPARAQVESREGIALQNQILELRHQLQVLQGQGGGGGASGGSALGAAQSSGTAAAGTGGQADLLAQLLDRVSTLEDEVRRQRGRIDELSNTVQHQGQDLAKQIDDLKFQMESPGGQPRTSPAGEAKAAGAATPETPPAAPAPNSAAPLAPAGKAAAAARTPEKMLHDAQAALDRKDYAAAEADARQALAKSRGGQAADAQFTLAAAFAGQKNYQQAALAYDDAYNRARTGPHAPAALLGLADALININAKPAACGTLNKLGKEFPTMRTELRQRATALRQRAGCH